MLMLYNFMVTEIKILFSIKNWIVEFVCLLSFPGINEGNQESCYGVAIHEACLQTSLFSLLHAEKAKEIKISVRL